MIGWCAACPFPLPCRMRDQHCSVTALQATNWVVRSLTHQAELLRLHCGGWRRPFSFFPRHPGCMAFAHYSSKDGLLHLHLPAAAQSTAGMGTAGQPAGGAAQQAGGLSRAAAAAIASSTATQPVGCDPGGLGTEGSTGAGAPATLHLMHHGREVLCCAVVPGPVQVVASASGSAQAAASASAAAQPPRTEAQQQQHVAGDHSAQAVELDAALSAPSKSGQAGSGASSVRQQQLRVACLGDAPEGMPSMCVLTGSEDGSIRTLMYCEGSDGAAQLCGAAEIGTHAAGTAVKALAAVQADEPGGAMGMCQSG